ncbi:DDE superfamily endonuclease [Streptomyces sp. 2131.1]|nr:DDE superfamily endonuclease [Streptomyces sp. 2131.1]
MVRLPRDHHFEGALADGGYAVRGCCTAGRSAGGTEPVPTWRPFARWADSAKKPLVDGFSTKRTGSTRGFTCLFTAAASTCPAPLCASWPAICARGIDGRVRGGSACRRAARPCWSWPTCVWATPTRQLAAGFGIGTATAYRYIREAIEVLAALAPTLQQAMDEARRKAFLILDGTLLPIDRITADRPYYSGKHKRHGMNVQVIADPHGKLLWASPALPGATHDLTAARTTGIIETLSATGLTTWADRAYQAAGTTHPGAHARPEAQAMAAPPQHHPRQDPLRRRTSRRHAEGLANPPQEPMQHQPDHRPCPSRAHPSSGQVNAKMKCAHCPRDRRTDRA